MGARGASGRIRSIDVENYVGCSVYGVKPWVADTKFPEWCWCGRFCRGEGDVELNGGFGARMGGDATDCVGCSLRLAGILGKAMGLGGNASATGDCMMPVGQWSTVKGIRYSP